MTEKIFRSIMAAAVCILLACVLIIMGCLYGYFAGLQEQQLMEELSFAAAGVETSGQAYLDDLEGEYSRLTWIGPDGSVIYDAQADETAMENHAQREEVQEAFASGQGRSQRYSSTLMEKTIYCAQRLEDGSVLRISVSTASMGMLVFGMLQPIGIVLVLALVLAFLLARRLSRRIVEPLNCLDLDHPLENETYDELAPLLTRINQQRRQIDAQLRQLRQKKDEFEQITLSMNEGLVLLSSGGMILSLNPAAEKLLHTSHSAVGQDFLTIERGRELNDALAHALKDGHSETFLERDGREYQVDMSRIESQGAPAGTVLLSFDVTDKIRAERTRREFTANVSHELKTPLTAILASSEMLESGMVQEGDIPRFVGHIHREAARLLALIEDIIRLSQLDEGVELPQETIDLALVAEEALDQLREKAAQHQVTLRIQAEPCPVQGIPRLAQEIVYNLVDNAIKYNVEGGSVQVTVRSQGTLTVADTGIGIPPEHQDRVFERFYRVDKSHSRQIGGTGLGLSIVKHGCACLGASIHLESQPEKGTTIQVQFPTTGSADEEK